MISSRCITVSVLLMFIFEDFASVFINSASLKRVYSFCFIWKRAWELTKRGLQLLVPHLGMIHHVI